jgi:hypothetical protein
MKLAEPKVSSTPAAIVQLRSLLTPFLSLLQEKNSSFLRRFFKLYMHTNRDRLNEYELVGAAGLQKQQYYTGLVNGWLVLYFCGILLPILRCEEKTAT